MFDKAAWPQVLKVKRLW